MNMIAAQPVPPLFRGWVVRIGSWSWRIVPRVLFVAISISAALAALSFATLMYGTLDLSLGEVWRALNGEGTPAAVRSVQNRRLPRLITAIGVGGSLGVAGAVFQTLSRNVLGSPDIIGFTTGAATAAVVQIVFFGGGVLQTAGAAVLGGMLTALLVYALARKDGVSGGLRLVLVGIGVGAMLSAVMSFLVVRADIDDATVVQQWTAGSLTGRGWPHAISVAIAVGVLVPALVVVFRRVTMMEMGDDAASSLGISVERYRFAGILLAVALTGAATAATGLIAFVALAAPQIARRLARRSGVLVATSFLLGAVLLAGADLIAQAVEVGLRTPVGLVTSLLGGAYLIWLLARQA